MALKRKFTATATAQKVLAAPARRSTRSHGLTADEDEEKALASTDLKVEKEKVAAVEDDDEEEDDEEDDEQGGGMELSAFEKERLENIRRNKEYLRSLGLGDTKAAMGLSAEAIRAKQAARKRAPSKPRPKREPVQPTRRSTRGMGKDAPIYNEEKILEDLHAQAEIEREKRMDEGPLTLETISKTEEGGEGFLDLLKQLMKEREEEGEQGEESKGASIAKPNMDYAGRLARLSLAEEDVKKLTPVRVTSMVIHPSERTLVVVAADNDGNLGVWQVDGGGVFKFRPHITKVASMQYHPADNTQLISASHDGTVRNLDLSKEVFDLVIASGEKFPDSGFTCAHMAAHSPNNLLLAGHQCSTGLLDFRSKELSWVVEAAHDKKVNSIEAHPTQEYLFVTSSTDRSVKLWDIRKPKKAIWSIPHTNSINTASFNPTGDCMVVTCQDHNLYIHEDPTKKADPSVSFAKYKIKHNNNTGRWLSKFWPTWDPKQPDAFVVGSLEQPRRIEVYSASSGYQIASVRSEFMNSVQSINVFHPTRNILVGANSSGRIHVYRGP